MALYNCKSYFEVKVEDSDDDDNNHDINSDDNDNNNTNTTTRNNNNNNNNNKRSVNQLWFSNLLHIICGKWLKPNNQRT